MRTYLQCVQTIVQAHARIVQCVITAGDTMYACGAQGGPRDQQNRLAYASYAKQPKSIHYEHIVCNNRSLTYLCL